MPTDAVFEAVFAHAGPWPLEAALRAPARGR